MDAMVIMRRCRNYADEIERINERIERRRAVVERTTAAYGTEGGGHGSSGDKMLEYIEKADALIDLRNERERAHDAELMVAATLLDGLERLDAKVLERYYMKCEKISVIAKRMKYTEQYIRRKKRSGEAALMEVGDVSAMMPDWYMEREKVR